MNGLIISESVSIKEFEKKVLEEMKKGIEFFEKELSKLRTNRAHPSLIEDIKIVTYGSSMPLKNIAVITVSDSNILIIQPYDITIINDIEKSLGSCNLGGQPKNDGKIIKIVLPQMSQERRNELIKIVSKKQEESLIFIRKMRQDILTLIKQNEKDKKISEDSSQRFQKSLQGILENITQNISQISKKKEISLLD